MKLFKKIKTVLLIAFVAALVVPVAAATFNLHWPANPASEQVLAYHVTILTNGNPSTGVFQPFVTVGGDVTNVNTNLANGAKYHFKVQAENSTGLGPVSAVVSSPNVPSIVGQPILETSP